MHFEYQGWLESMQEHDVQTFFLFFVLVSGGRSRLHLIDLGSCEKVLSKSRDGGGSLCLSLSALGNVILALINGAKHVPYK